MKSVLILNSLYKPNVGGVENSIFELSKSFNKIGFDVDLVCSNRNFVNDDILGYFQSEENCSIYRYNVLDAGYIQQIKNCYRLIKSMLKSNNYDSIISRGYVTSFCLFLLRVEYLYLVPSVIFFQGRKNFIKMNWKEKINYTFSSVIQTLAITGSQSVVFSPGMIKQVERINFSNKKPILSKFGVDKTRFFKISNEIKKRNRESLGLSENDKVLLCLGRFSEIKNFHVAIESIYHLPNDYKLLLVGSGPMEVHYKERIELLGLRNRVFLYDATSRPEFYYQISDVFLMTSRYEAFGQVLLEATSCHLKVIAFEPGKNVVTNTKSIYEGFPSLVHYCEKADEKSLSKVIASSSNKELSTKELTRFLESYCWDNLARSLLSLEKK